MDPDLTKRAMMSWNQTRGNRRNKLLFFVMCIAVGLVIGLVGSFTGLFDLLSRDAVIGTLVGFYAGLLVWMLVARHQINKLAGMAKVQNDKQGSVTAIYAPEGVEVTTRFTTSRNAWATYDDVILIDGATVLRAGGVVYPVPHTALPQGVTPERFFADIKRWQDAGQ